MSRADQRKGRARGQLPPFGENDQTQCRAFGHGGSRLPRGCLSGSKGVFTGYEKFGLSGTNEGPIFV